MEMIAPTMNKIAVQMVGLLQVMMICTWVKLTTTLRVTVLHADMNSIIQNNPSDFQHSKMK